MAKCCIEANRKKLIWKCFLSICLGLLHLPNNIFSHNDHPVKVMMQQSNEISIITHSTGVAKLFERESKTFYF